MRSPAAPPPRAAAIADERKQLDALIGAQSTALCQKIAASVGDRLGRYAAASHASHAADLPAAIEAAIGEYAAGAAGAAKAEGLHALLTGRVLPLVRSTLAAVEEGARAATVKCVKPGLLWGLDRISYRKIVQAAHDSANNSLVAMLKACEPLKPLDSAQINALASTKQIVRCHRGQQLHPLTGSTTRQPATVSYSK